MARDKAASRGFSGYLSGPPAFRDEKKFLPLQGADLFAWEHRNHLVKNKLVINPPTMRWREIDKIRTFSMQFDSSHLNRMNSHLLEIPADFIAKYPGAPLFPAGRSYRRLTRRNARKSS
jgi:hypothetical protein